MSRHLRRLGRLVDRLITTTRPSEPRPCPEHTSSTHRPDHVDVVLVQVLLELHVRPGHHGLRRRLEPRLQPHRRNPGESAFTQLNKIIRSRRTHLALEAGHEPAEVIRVPRGEELTCLKVSQHDNTPVNTPWACPMTREARVPPYLGDGLLRALHRVSRERQVGRALAQRRQALLDRWDAILVAVQKARTPRQSISDQPDTHCLCLLDIYARCA